MKNRILKWLGLGSVGLLVAMTTPPAGGFFVATGPDSVRGNVELRGASLRPVVRLSWVDTSNALVLTEVLRRGPAPDSAFRKIGVVWLNDSTKNGLTTLTNRYYFEDLYARRGVSYGYRLQDSLRGSASRVVMPTDTFHISVP